jgi:hypothetical protein
MASKVKRRKAKKARNLIAVAAFQRSGSGRHQDQRKAASKKACRGRVNLDG